jgi:23S rRNA pseudouridine1911/1915/1917 synthase
MPADNLFRIRVRPSDEGIRLDVLLSSLLEDCTRTFAAGLIAAEQVRVDGRPKKPGYRVKSGENISGSMPAPVPVEFKPEPIPINIVYEDDHIIVVNKQPGLVVHPAPGHFSGTLANGLLYHCRELGGIGGDLRSGIVHRLDKNTSGILVVAKNDAAHMRLSRQFKSRRVKKDYLALVHGNMKSPAGSIKLPIGRHPVDRKRMSTVSPRGRTAETEWKIIEQFQGIALLEVHLKTGRTHQIRVHCAAMHHPIVGDRVYGPRKPQKTLDRRRLPSDKLLQILKSVERQMLHAWRLSFRHPHTGKAVTFESRLPEDMAIIIQRIREIGS